MRPKIAHRKTHNQARHLRHNLTHTEQRLWAQLRNHRIANVHFRRQYSIGKYFVDFCAPYRKLIIEIDGSQHLANEESDLLRTAYLNSKGYKVLQFWNRDVQSDIKGVITAIELALQEDDKK